jgi:acetate kinase
MLILVVNCGSSSLKVGLLRLDEAWTEVASVVVRGPGPELEAMLKVGSSSDRLALTAVDPAGAVEASIAALADRGLLEGLNGVGHRVVHGGSRLVEPVLLSPETVRAIEAVSELAPLHNGPALAAIKAAAAALPGTPAVATFDTAFFRDLPVVASTYALPGELVEELGIRRFGFHGFAHRYMAERFAAISGRDDSNLVTLQLGGGCSATALRGSNPVDTSMGFTPLEGLVMATRSGDIDPSLPLYIAERRGLSLDEVDQLLNNRSGLAGLAGGEGDVRRLLERETGGDAAVRLALDLFCYRARKYVGAYAAVLGGIDGLVFGGGIGENSAALRARICAGLEWMGIEIDERPNETAAGDSRISTAAGRVDVRVVAVDEARVIAADTASVLSGDRKQA